MYSDKAYKLDYSMSNSINNEQQQEQQQEQQLTPIPYLTERASDKYSQIKSMQQVAMNKLQAKPTMQASNDNVNPVKPVKPVKPIGDSDDASY